MLLVATTVDYNETETSTNITDIDFVNETIITPQKVIPTGKTAINNFVNQLNQLPINVLCQNFDVII